MTTSYSAELLEAQERTIRLGLSCPEIPPTCGRLLTPEKHEQFPYAVRDAVGELGVEAVVAQCLSLHWHLKEPLEKFFGVPILYTIGYVHTPPSYMFKQTEADLQRLLQNGINTPQLNIHAWLTLPSAEIIDMSLPTSVAVLNQMKEGRGSVLAAHADELKHGLRYHPMLLGDAFLRKIGALVEFHVFGI
jgi:hypothetical protein